MHLYHTVFGMTAVLGAAGVLLSRKLPSGGGRMTLYLLAPILTILLFTGFAAYFNGY